MSIEDRMTWLDETDCSHRHARPVEVTAEDVKDALTFQVLLSN